jgi:ketosteroid isomerase-like protein
MSTTTAPSSSAKPSFQMPPPSAEHQATQKVAARFHELISARKNLDAMKELYADNARHVEVMEAPWCPRVTEGKAALLKKGEEFGKMTTVHSASCGAPVVNGDQFLCAMTMDCTSNAGPMAGQRMTMTETALYTVKNGKIVEGKFFYGCGA